MTEFLGAGLALGLAAGLTPGPLMALVLTQAVRHGPREGAKAALAPLLTDAPIILVSLLVLSRLEGHAALLGAISLAGAVVVSLLAWECLRASGIDADRMPQAPDSLKRGVLVNALSPHPYLFWLTVGGPTALRGAHAGLAAALGFILCFSASLVGAKLAVAVLAGRSRRMISGRGYVWVMRGLGLCLAWFALGLGRDGLSLLGLLPS